MAISFNQGGGNVFNFGNKSTQVNSENKKLLLNASAQEINQAMSMNPQNGDSVTFNQGNNNNASFQGFGENGLLNMGGQLVNQAMVMGAPPSSPTFIFPTDCPPSVPPTTCLPPPPTSLPPPPTSLPPPPTSLPPPPTSLPPPPTSLPPPPPPTSIPPQPSLPPVCMVPCIDYKDPLNPNDDEFHYYLPVDNSSEFGFLPNDPNSLDQKDSTYTDPKAGYYFHASDYSYDIDQTTGKRVGVPENKKLTYEEYQTQLANYQNGDTDITYG
jgi:hypothetical protein